METLQFRQRYEKPQSPHAMIGFVPRRLINRMLCSPAIIFFSIFLQKEDGLLRRFKRLNNLKVNWNSYIRLLNFLILNQLLISSV